MLELNFLFKTDGYKPSHADVFPDYTDGISNYMESRGGLYPKTIFFGNQAFMMDKLEGKVFDWRDVKEADEFYKEYGVSFSAQRWYDLYDAHGGHLPIRIKAPKEGTLIETHNVLTTCEATDPEFFWLPGYIETQRLRGVWDPTTIATHSFYIKKLILARLMKTADDPWAEINFKLHDFGARGVSSEESAQIGGMAHLVNFMGSDTIEGIRAAMHYYGVKNGIPAYSINASEHAVVLAFGKSNEYRAYDKQIEKWAKPGSMFASVSDTYDFFNVVENVWGGSHGQRVKEIGATVVIRPDSGNPPDVIVEALAILKNKGLTAPNSKGYHVLQPHLRMIQGDGLEKLADFDAIYDKMEEHGFSASNIGFGMGGGLLQKVNRDTQKFADKPSEVSVSDQWYPIQKQPKTDSGKRSKQGKLILVNTDSDGFKTFSDIDNPQEYEANKKYCLLETTFENGYVIRKQTLDNVREIANSYL